MTLNKHLSALNAGFGAGGFFSERWPFMISVMAKKTVPIEQRRVILIRIVERQLQQNDPPETAETLERLISEGHTHEQAMELIAVIVGTELYDMFKGKELFDRDRFVSRLNDLPKLPK